MGKFLARLWPALFVFHLNLLPAGPMAYGAPPDLTTLLSEQPEAAQRLLCILEQICNTNDLDPQEAIEVIEKNLGSWGRFKQVYVELPADQRISVYEKDGQSTYVLEKPMTLKSNRTVHFPDSHVSQDQISGGLNANSLETRELFNQLIDFNSQAESQASLLLIDVNNLGFANYFEDGMAAGDAYLARTAEVFLKHFSDDPGHVFFRLGGDEFALLTKTLSQEDIKDRIAEAKAAIQEDFVIAAIFDNSAVSPSRHQEKLRILSDPKVNSFDTLPDDSHEFFLRSELLALQRDFSEFKAYYLSPENNERLKRLQLVVPGVSVGPVALSEVNGHVQAMRLINDRMNQDKLTQKTHLAEKAGNPGSPTKLDLNPWQEEPQTTTAESCSEALTDNMAELANPTSRRNDRRQENRQGPGRRQSN